MRNARMCARCLPTQYRYSFFFLSSSTERYDVKAAKWMCLATHIWWAQVNIKIHLKLPQIPCNNVQLFDLPPFCSHFSLQLLFLFLFYVQLLLLRLLSISCSIRSLVLQPQLPLCLIFRILIWLLVLKS